MRLVLWLGGTPIEFTEPLSGGLFPYLSKVGTLRLEARGGYRDGLGVGESPSVLVSLANNDNRAANIIGQPLRARGDVYNGDDSLYWSGLVSRIAYGNEIDIEIQA